MAGRLASIRAARSESAEEESDFEDFQETLKKYSHLSEELDPLKFGGKNKLLKELKDLEDVINEYSEGYDEEKAVRVNMLVGAISMGMGELMSYLFNSRQNIESIRTPIAAISTAISQKVAEISKEAVKDSPEVCHLDVQQKRLGQQLAALNDELLQASKQTAEAEMATLDAQKVCAETCAIAEKLKEEMELKKKEMAEAALRVELEKQMALERELEERKKQEELEALQKLKELELQEEAFLWPTFPLNIESVNEFDGGVGCLVKTDPAILYERDINCQVMDPNELNYNFLDDEELVSNILKVYMTNCDCNDGAVMFNPGLCLSFPHCMPKQQNSTREVIVKLLTHPEMPWVELKTSDKIFETYKDIRFAQAQTTFIGTFMVISRNKQATIRFKRKGGKRTTTLDSKILIKASADTFAKPEKLILQLHPIDQPSMKQLRKATVLALNLISSSAVYSMSWVNKQFSEPVKINVPLPPNPAILKKLAKNKPMKDDDNKRIEGEMKSESKIPESRTRVGMDASLEHDEDAKTSALNKPINWYLGIYDLEAEDESDTIFLLRKKKDKWVTENVPVERTALLDVVEVTLREPLEDFVLFRTTTRINAKDAEHMMGNLDRLMSRKIVQFVVSQHNDNPSIVVAAILPHSKVEKYVTSMSEKDFTPVYVKDRIFLLKEGSKIRITFRGNIKCTNPPQHLETTFFVNFECSLILALKEHDVFVQKCYDVYRGFVQVSQSSEGPPLDLKKSMIFQTGSVLDEHLVTLPKDKELLSGKAIPRAPISYRDISCDLKLDILTKLASELEKEWMDLGVALGLSSVLLHTIESNASHHKRPAATKVLDMLKNWIKIQYRLSNKIDVLCVALNKVNRQDLVKIFELPGTTLVEEESTKTEHTDVSKGSWFQDVNQFQVNFVIF